MKENCFFKLCLGVIMILIVFSCENSLIDKDEDAQESNVNQEGLIQGEINRNTFMALVDGTRSLEEGSNGYPEFINDAIVEAFNNMTLEEKKDALSKDTIDIAWGESIDFCDENRKSNDDQLLDLYEIELKIKKKLHEAFLGKTVQDYDLEINGKHIYLDLKVYAGDLAEILIGEDKWDELVTIVINTGATLDIDEIKELRNQYNVLNGYINNAENRSSTGSHYDTAMVTNLGGMLANGEILVLKGRNASSASVISSVVGEYGHAGIFDRDSWLRNGQTDEVMCMLSAQNNQNRIDADFISNNPDHITREKLTYYTYNKQIKVLRPYAYNSSNATSAVDYATGYTDKSNPAVYDLPEMDYFTSNGGTSHDGNPENKAYCTKLVYCAWSHAGVNTDSDVPNKNRGSIIAPDDIYKSTYNQTWSTYVFGILVSYHSFSKTTYTRLSYSQ